MKTYTTSRLSGGNRLFPSSITLTESGVVIHDPSLFSGKESTTPYNKIASVKVHRPIIGFSNIILDIMGADRLVIHGFTADDANHIKTEILQKIS